jgi:hypothetical protein
MLRSIRTAALVLIAGACSHAPPPETTADGNTASAPTTQKSEQMITEQEIIDSQALTAYDAVVKLRGNFLTNRGKTSILGNSPTVPTVYLDGQVYGNPSTLKNISAKHVASIRLYRAWEASTRFGASNVGGVIEVLTKTQ